MTCLLRPLVATALVASVAGCAGSGAGGTGSQGNGKPSIVVSTNILGDVVSSIVGDSATVTTILPVGSNPHDFQASAKETATIRSADLLVVNGGGFEEGLTDVIEGAEGDGVPVVEAIDLVEAMEGDPHFFTDPIRMSAAAKGIAGAIHEEIDGVDADAIAAATDEYVQELETLDEQIETQLAGVAPPNRVLVTNHEVFGYFADRYEFRIVGVVVPGGSDGDGGSAQELAALVQVIREQGAPAIFVDSSGSDDLAQTLADEVGDVVIVELFSESLGPPGSGAATYIEMMETNAARIAEALV